MKELIPFLNSTVNKRFRDNHYVFLSGGYANGYVAVPPGHPLFGKHYDEVEVNIHGGLTYSGMSENFDESEDLETIDDDSNTVPHGWWVFGFDTLHCGDDMQTCGREFCVAETLRLKQQLEVKRHKGAHHEKDIISLTAVCDAVRLSKRWVQGLPLPDSP